jgi:Fucose permease
MENNNTQHGNIIAIITMMFLFAMISFVTNLAAPIGVIWKNVFSGTGSANMIGMLGNAMNFLAYLFMGIPAGKLLTKIGYKKTALAGIATGFVGVLIQFVSGKFGADISGFAIYLFGAFISGFAVCILNTVVNPMLNLLGGGGNRGNQLNLIGGTLNSLSGTLTPMLVGALIGTVTANTKMADINFVLFIALGVFAMAFIVLLFIPIADPEMGKTTSNTVFEHSPWAFRHFVLGTIAIFVYVGVEVGIPGTLNFYISDASAKGAGLVGNAAAVGGFVAGTYWLLMLVGRFIGSFIGGSVSSRTMMIGTTTLGMVLIIAAMMMVVGGGLLPLVQNFIADHSNYMVSYIVPLLAIAFM